MPQNYPSIFNDVIGPIMRGPSSSHCAASHRIGRLARDLMGGEYDDVLIEFDPSSSLATTHSSHGSDIGLYGGLLGWEIHDERLMNATAAIHQAGIKANIRIVDYGAQHPNTYRITLKNRGITNRIVAISTGGGMIEIIEIDGVPVSIAGDYFETLVYLDANEDAIIRQIKENARLDHLNLCQGENTKFIEIKAQEFLSNELCHDIESKPEVQAVKKLAPILPVLSHRGVSVPYLNCEEMLKYNNESNLDLWELAIIYESARGNISENDIFKKINEIAQIMINSIEQGIAGTQFANRILGHQSGFFKTQMADKKLLDGGMLNRMVLYVTAMMEVKSAMGVIVAAPTAGSCGTLPGVCFGAARFMGLDDNAIAKGLLAAGLIGVIIAARSTFAAEEAGCQAECGAASGMAAAALVTLARGNSHQAISASSMALQNIFGMTCDPVANRVEVPCLGKNVLAVGNALSSANMALADFDQVIPLDEVIDAMDAVGRSIPRNLRCTALGGLSATRHSREIEKRLKAFD